MLKWKLFRMFAVITILISCITFSVTFFTVRKQVVESRQHSVQAIFDQYAGNLSGTIDACRSETLGIAANTQVQSVLKEFDAQAYSDESLQQARDGISGTLTAHERYLLLARQDAMYARYTITLFGVKENSYYLLYSDSVYDEMDPLIMDKLRAGSVYCEFRPMGTQPSISMWKAIYDDVTYHSIIGIVRCDIPLDDLRTHIFSPLYAGSQISTYLIDSKTGNSCVHGVPYADLISPQSLTETRSYLSDKLFIMEKKLNYGNLYLIGITSMASVQQTLFSALAGVIIGTAAALRLALALAAAFSANITKPIRTLSETLRRERGFEEPLPLPKHHIREIDDLYRSFNKMSRSLDELIYENYIKELNRKQSELNALQSQINTHFLYNTLDTVNWLALDYGAKDISLIVNSLSSLLRLSLNHGHEMLTVEDEVNHVRSYVGIQLIRFDNSFDVTYRVDPAVQYCKVPKMLLQPLVENALLHGIEKSRDGRHIWVDVHLEDGFLCERVTNEGDCIDLDEMEHLTRVTMDFENSTHYGVRSIAERLFILYEGKARYTYRTEHGNTVAEIRIPCAPHPADGTPAPDGPSEG